MIVIITEVLRNQFILSFSFFDENDENFDDNENDDFDDYRLISVIRFTENVEFFNFDYVDVDNFVIINVDRHVFYWNVYVFDDRLKNLAKDSIDEQRMRKLISKCFRDEAFKWYFMKMTKFEKNFFRVVFIEQWMSAFIK